MIYCSMVVQHKYLITTIEALIEEKFILNFIKVAQIILLIFLTLILLILAGTECIDYCDTIDICVYVYALHTAKKLY